MNYLLAIIALAALVLSVSKKQWNLSLVALGLSIAPLLLIADGVGLFYHSLGIALISLLLFFPILILQKPRESKKHSKLILLALIPYILVILLKLFHLQGIALLRWTLLISILTFVYLTIDRRKFDNVWFILLYMAISSGLILTF